jgi:PPOX class probable F420-dependent enzyme
MAPRTATAEHVDRQALLGFARDRHHLVLTTFRSDGSPQISPVTGGVDEQGRIVIASYPQRAKSKNIQRTPRASVLVLSDDFDGPYVQIDGAAECIVVPDAVEPLVDYFRAVAGEHSDWAEYRQAMLDQGKCLLRVTPERWGPVATGGFPPELG